MTGHCHFPCRDRETTSHREIKPDNGTPSFTPFATAVSLRLIATQAFHSEPSIAPTSDATRLAGSILLVQSRKTFGVSDGKTLVFTDVKAFQEGLYTFTDTANAEYQILNLLHALGSGSALIWWNTELSAQRRHSCEMGDCKWFLLLSASDSSCHRDGHVHIGQSPPHRAHGLRYSQPGPHTVELHPEEKLYSTRWIFRFVKICLLREARAPWRHTWPRWNPTIPSLTDAVTNRSHCRADGYNGCHCRSNRRQRGRSNAREAGTVMEDEIAVEAAAEMEANTTAPLSSTTLTATGTVATGAAALHAKPSSDQGANQPISSSPSSPIYLGAPISESPRSETFEYLRVGHPADEA
ncbi:hypothetical protein CONLIGDRAFT_649018 [Coniochaeta ligniaria NRRL 30616]|uniref:Uncharacterized protein n=1 Tax=Coniochaeta ligniaria NRRL 30616 TaxID=1408157 RepID=A0A1J7I9X9_9PEZI|nr:hypothetical protein CONLIGDRAFT_649018 [Coniochaeta ligniaria NRRL 30616]